MNKRKILTLALSLCMVAILAIGGSLAYLTDTDNATNTFTVGNVKIDLIEKDENGDDWSEKQLMPGAWNQNNVVKDVTVQNVGDNPAFMWVEIWIPKELDDPTDASKNNLHWNNFDTYMVNGVATPVHSSVAKAEGYELKAVTASEYIGEKDGYNGYRLWIENDVAYTSGNSTYSLLYQVYMDSRIDHCTTAGCSCGGNGYILVDGTCYNDSWEIKVNAFGIQSEGLTDQTGDGKVTVEDAIIIYGKQIAA